MLFVNVLWYASYTMLCISKCAEHLIRAILQLINYGLYSKYRFIYVQVNRLLCLHALELQTLFQKHVTFKVKQVDTAF